MTQCIKELFSQRQQEGNGKQHFKNFLILEDFSVDIFDSKRRENSERSFFPFSLVHLLFLFSLLHLLSSFRTCTYCFERGKGGNEKKFFQLMIHFLFQFCFSVCGRHVEFQGLKNQFFETIFLKFL